ncbi:MAG: SPFH domain-containing protein [Firmicutes bacterium]|nr:SPFH domain-containing protein [Bacillota bacterium]
MPILKNIEWLDSTNNTLVHKIDASQNHINRGSVLTVRDSQVAIFSHRGQMADVFLPGKYKLETNNIPVLTRLMSWKYGFETPFKSDVYFVNTKQFTNQKWGTTQPITIRDSDYGAIQVRAFGAYSFKVDDAFIFMKEIFGTTSSFKTEDITGYLRTIIISAMTTAIGKSGKPFLDLAANLAEFSKEVEKEELEQFKAKGLQLTRFIIENVSLPKELQDALNKSTSLRMMGNNIGTYQQMAAADAMRNAASNPGMAGSFMGAGMGLGMGAQMGNVFGQAMGQGMVNQQQPMQQAPQSNQQQALAGVPCSKCNASVKPTAKFCHECGNTMGNACAKCKAMLKPSAKFCHECGGSTVNACKCGQELKAGAKFCPSCGEKQ